jgi:glycosyltransferase involved in cell wall biosynthesis
VHHRIRRDEPADYLRVARGLEHCADVVSIQFEAGIWGGENGDAVLDFVHELSLPATVTLHTLPVEPSARQREILVELVESVDAAVVMSEGAAALLADGYGIARERINVIPYGVPELPIMSAESIKPSVALDGRDVLLSFGLLAPDKGFELMIDALPAVVAAHPKTTYVILGATHPDVRLRDREAYRDSLTRRAKSLGVADHLRLVPEFVGRVELARWLQAADVFVAPENDLGKTVSGPLSYAMAAGRAIVATRTSYAVEMLGDGAGVLVDSDAASLAAAVNELLDDPDERAAIGAVAHERSRAMIWTGVGAAYEALHARVAEQADRKIVKRGRTMTGISR